MCSKMYDYKDLEPYVASDWLEVLIKEYEEEVKGEARWPTLLLQNPTRHIVWHLCIILELTNKGVPASACSLMERYLARHVRNFLQQPRNDEEWDRYKEMIASRLHRIMLACVMLAGKMSCLQAPLSASSVNYSLSKKGICYTTTEIVEMECHVFKTLDYRIPLWTTLEMTEFLTRRLGIEEVPVLLAAGMVITLAEYHRFDIDRHMRIRSLSNTPGSSSSSPSGCLNTVSLYNLHLCAGAVSATIKYMKYPLPAPSAKLAVIVRTSADYIRAISNKISDVLSAIPTEPKTSGPPQKKRRIL